MSDKTIEPSDKKYLTESPMQTAPVRRERIAFCAPEQRIPKQARRRIAVLGFL
jgi:hypothetical protein